jgi:hypothetical protein
MESNLGGDGGALPAPVFGALGTSLATAVHTPFWQWFHFEQTGRSDGVCRFQPNGRKFHSFCYLDASLSAKDDLRSLTLGVQRLFIEGADEPFARDLVRSFLHAVFPEQEFEPVRRMANEVGSKHGGSRPVIVAAGTHRNAPSGDPSRPYEVFLGRRKSCTVKAGLFVLHLENADSESTRWFRLGVTPYQSLKPRLVSLWKSWITLSAE